MHVPVLNCLKAALCARVRFGILLLLQTQSRPLTSQTSQSQDSGESTHRLQVEQANVLLALFNLT